jgi:hypothetical protein
MRMVEDAPSMIKNQHGFQQNLSIYVGFPATTAYAAAFRGFPGFPTGLLTGYTSGNQTSQQAFSQDIHQGHQAF